jgi:hypothetical protein
MKVFSRQADEFSVSKTSGFQQRKYCVLKDEYISWSKE